MAPLEPIISHVKNGEKKKKSLLATLRNFTREQPIGIYVYRKNTEVVLFSEKHTHTHTHMQAHTCS